MTPEQQALLEEVVQHLVVIRFLICIILGMLIGSAIGRFIA